MSQSIHINGITFGITLSFLINFAKNINNKKVGEKFSLE